MGTLRPRPCCLRILARLRQKNKVESAALRAMWNEVNKDKHKLLETPGSDARNSESSQGCKRKTPSSEAPSNEKKKTPSNEAPSNDKKKTPSNEAPSNEKKNTPSNEAPSNEKKTSPKKHSPKLQAIWYCRNWKRYNLPPPEQLPGSENSMILWTGKQATCAGEWASSLLEDVFTVFDDLAPHRRCAKYVPVPKKVIDLTNVPSEQDRDPIVELLKATEEFEALSPAVSFMLVPKAATAATQRLQFYPRKAATPVKERKQGKPKNAALWHSNLIKRLTFELLLRSWQPSRGPVSTSARRPRCPQHPAQFNGLAR